MTYPVDVFATTDGHIVMVVTSDRAFEYVQGIGKPEMAEDEKFPVADRNANEAELKAAIEAWTSTLSRDGAVDALASRHTGGILLSVGDIAGSHHIAYRGMTTTLKLVMYPWCTSL